MESTLTFSLFFWFGVINCCLEALRVDSKNMKAIYRIAFSYFKSDKLDQAKKYIDDALNIDKNEKLFLDLKKNVEDKEKENDMKSARMFKKILKWFMIYYF